LHDHGGSDDGGDTEFHESTSVRGENGAHPVEGVRLLRVNNAIEWDLAAEQVDEDDNACPNLFGFESDLNRTSSTLAVGCSISGMTAIAGFNKYNNLVP
jgi:hypothetical protein